MTTTLPSIELGFREGPSDKIYRASIEKSGDGFLVLFAYGRRGATLNTGDKTPCPVPYDKALSIYNALIQAKTTKGYKPTGGASATGAGLGTTVTTRERRDTGLRAQLLNPIDEDELLDYLDDDRWCAQEKFDGKRMLLRKRGTELIATNRDGLATGFPQEFARRLAYIPGDFVVDGESVGETFYAFDLLEDAAGDRRQQPYRDRLAALQARLGRAGGCIVVAETAYGADKRALLQRLKAGNREGIVFKDVDAPWTAGRPASGGTAMKCKFWATCSCVVAKINARRSVELQLGNQPVGNVTIPPNHQLPAVGQVVEIRYLYVTAPGGSLYQPIYLGVRDDVPATDCTVERQRIKYKAAA